MQPARRQATPTAAARPAAARPAAAEQPAVKQYHFPSEPPDVVLTDEQRTERYGLEVGQMPSGLVREFAQFRKWETLPINLERSPRYARAAQEATAAGNAKSMRGFVGYTMAYFGVALPNLSLSSYADPEIIMHFIFYLKERGCGRGQLLKHVG